MSLFGLPPELLREILVHAVSIRDLKRSLRLRLVNRYFSEEVAPALYETNILEDYLKHNKVDADQGPEHDQFWQRYLTNKIVGGKKTLSDREGNLRFMAVAISRARKDSGSEAVRERVHLLCYQPYRILATTPRPVQPWSTSRIALQAAIIYGLKVFFNMMVGEPDFHGVVGRCPDEGVVEMWEDPVVLIAHFGRIHFLEMLFNDKRLSRETTRRQALGPAIRAGRLDVVRFILNPKWGPIDFSGSPVDTQDIITGTLNSPQVDFFPQLVNIFRSCDENQHPSGGTAPDINKILHDVAYHTPQRADVAQWLLASGAVVQVRQPPRKRAATRMSKSTERRAEKHEACWPWNPLRRAVMGGNEKIVHLLLDAGADPNLTDIDVLDQAVKHGSLNIVRMLVEHGAADAIQGGGVGPRTPEVLTKHALATENDELCGYLRCIGIMPYGKLPSAVSASEHRCWDRR